MLKMPPPTDSSVFGMFLAEVDIISASSRAYAPIGIVFLTDKVVFVFVNDIHIVLQLVGLLQSLVNDDKLITSAFFFYFDGSRADLAPCIGLCACCGSSNGTLGSILIRCEGDGYGTILSSNAGCWGHRTIRRFELYGLSAIARPFASLRCVAFQLVVDGSSSALLNVLRSGRWCQAIIDGKSRPVVSLDAIFFINSRTFLSLFALGTQHNLGLHRAALRVSQCVESTDVAVLVGIAIGEYFRDRGFAALVVYDDLPECMKGHVKGGGSLTALPIIETQAGDVSAYIPTNVISITDGQIFLESDLFNQGFRPAINVGISVSRVGGSAQIKSMKKVAGTLKIDQAQYRELEAFSKFSSDMDAVTAMTLDRGRKNNQLLIQPQYSPMPVGEQIAILYCGVHGLMREVPIDKVRQCQDQFLDKLRSTAPEVIETLASGKIDDATTSRIEATMADIAGTYKA